MKKTLILLSSIILIACNSTKYSTEIMESPYPLIVYKTKGDYYNLVPVQLNKEGTDISSYPGPGDLSYEGKTALPAKLSKGYLLDNRGINKYTAFTSYTYEEYSALEKAPAKEELMKSIIDAHPFTELYNCGKRTGENTSIEALNSLIKKNFENCKDLLE